VADLADGAILRWNVAPTQKKMSDACTIDGLSVAENVDDIIYGQSALVHSLDRVLGEVNVLGEHVHLLSCLKGILQRRVRVGFLMFHYIHKLYMRL
jgi:hypothetical protein